MANKDYENGKRWGYALFKSNLKLFGRAGVHKSDAAHTTCRKYERDKRLTKTRDGKALTSDRRDAYRGIADGLSEAYGKFMYGRR